MIDDRVEDEAETVWERYQTVWSTLRAVAFSQCMGAGVRLLTEDGSVLDTNCEADIDLLLTDLEIEIVGDILHNFKSANSKGEEIVLRQVCGPDGSYRYGLSPCVDFAIQCDQRIRDLYEEWSLALDELTLAHPGDIKKGYLWVL